MENKKTLGTLIKECVEKKGLTKVEFAQLIPMAKNSVHKIFNKNSIQVDQLRRICEVLDHNFFDDIANDYGLADLPSDEEMKQKALNRFNDVVPKILKEMDIDPIFVKGRPIDLPEDHPIPDFILDLYNICFCVGESFIERADGKYDQIFDYKTYSDKNGNEVIIATNRFNNEAICHVKIEYMSENEWIELIHFAKKMIDRYYAPFQLDRIEEQIRRNNARRLYIENLR